MSGKKNHQHNKKQQHAKLTVKSTKALPNWLPPLLIVVATLIAYATSYTNEFIMNWDDAGYIINNDYIKSFSAENIRGIFSDYYMSNYHPLTTISYAIDYSIAGENPAWYHFVNMFFHLLNALLVFTFIRKLLKTTSQWIPFVVAALFALHPMHVESVAWISERKDVLYTFFFLLGLLRYLEYIRSENRRLLNFVVLIVFFGLSLLSKSAAVVFPIVLFAIDWYDRRKLSVIMFAEKLPLLALSVWFGLMAIQSQDTAMQDLAPLLTLFERLLIVNYAFITYIWKFFIPVELSAMYPYPIKVNDTLPVVYFIAPIFTILVAGFVIWMRKRSRELLFGLVFFIITIALVLQLVPVGGTILSERYSYLPYIGLSIPLAVWLEEHLKRSSLFRIIVIVVLVIFAGLSFNRVSYWKNGDVLFTDVVKKYPSLPYAWNNRGFLYWDYYAIKVFKDNPVKKDLYVNKAWSDYTKALQLDPGYVQAWANRAILLYNTGRPEESLTDFNMVLQLDSVYTDGLIGRANTLSTIGKFEESLPDYNSYLKKKPDDERAYVWRATALANIKEYEKALIDLKTARKLDPDDHESWYWTGLCYYNTNRNDSALYYFARTIEIKPDFIEVFVWQGLALHKAGQYQQAIESYNRSLSAKPNDPVALVNRAVAYYEINDFVKAMADLDAAGGMGYPLNPAFYIAVKNHDLKFQSKH
jgi:tetratricopeptide (TPR) repeat protein